MANLLIKDFITDIYVKAGNITRDQLPIEIVLKYLYDELNKRLKQAEISEQNALLKSVERDIIETREQNVSIDDFGTPVAVHLFDPNNGREIPVEMVNFNTLPDWENEGTLKCSIYGTPPKIRWSLMLNSYVNWRIKYWYEPNTEVAKGPNAEVSIVSPHFRPLITSVVTLDVLPYAEIPTDLKAGIASRLTGKVAEWEELWQADVDTSKQYGNNRRRPFRAGQPHTRGIRY